MTSFAVKIWLSFLLLAVGVYGTYKGLQLWRIASENDRNYTADLNVKPARPLADFKFTERSGKHVKLSDLAGEIFVVNFFFANCPGSCLTFNQTVAALQKEFGPQGIRFVSVTVDPTTDTPERLAKYAERFDADKDRWWFLNAPLSDTQDLGLSLKVRVQGVTHTDELIVIDRAGIVRGTFDHKDPAKLSLAKRKIQELLAEQPPGWKPTPAATPSGSAATAAVKRRPTK